MWGSQDEQGGGECKVCPQSHLEDMKPWKVKAQETLPERNRPRGCDRPPTGVSLLAFAVEKGRLTECHKYHGKPVSSGADSVTATLCLPHPDPEAHPQGS